MQRLQNEVASSSEKTVENRALFDEASERLKNLEKEHSELLTYTEELELKRKIKENSENLAEYLQYKIGYIDDNNKAFGMCSSILTKCQNYTYTDKNYNHNNQVIKEYLQRTLTQIKVAQDEIISGYAENCISDVTSCLSSNNSASNENYAINACKAQIVTCMSVNGDATADPKPTYIREWVKNMQKKTFFYLFQNYQNF